MHAGRMLAAVPVHLCYNSRRRDYYGAKEEFWKQQKIEQQEDEQ
jgi:hypothetical protein